MALTLKPQLLFDTFGGINRHQSAAMRTAPVGFRRRQSASKVAE